MFAGSCISNDAGFAIVVIPNAATVARNSRREDSHAADWAPSRRPLGVTTRPSALRLLSLFTPLSSLLEGRSSLYTLAGSSQSHCHLLPNRFRRICTARSRL
jgi:hypothetical protein